VQYGFFLSGIKVIHKYRSNKNKGARLAKIAAND